MESCSAKTQPVTSVPTRSDLNGQADAKRRALLTARLGEDRNDAQHHCGTISREDLDHRPQTCSGNSLGCGDH